MSSSYNINNIYLKPSVVNNTAIAGQALTVDATAGGVQFGTAFNDKTNFVVFDVQTADVIVTFDGQTPAAASKGHRLYAGQQYTWSKAAAQAAKFIRADTTSGFIWASEFQL